MLPHAEAEEPALYPAVERVLRGAGAATRTMSEISLPLLERLSADEARELLAALASAPGHEHRH
jgi:hypothetical protein